MTKRILKNYLNEVETLIKKIDLDNVLLLKKKILLTKKKNNKVFIFGNGGSSSTANHFAVDMTKNAKVETISLSNDNLITCFSNDYGFDNWIKNAVKYFVKKNDFVIFLSVSGKSKNIIKGIKYCKMNKIDYFSITGHKKNNPVNKISKCFLWVHSMSYNIVEIIHSIILLNIVDLIIGKNSYSSKR
ncbi:SIS domain-containing protein [Candidatus Pelagibacter sp.]|nr:SIS domain-containing protein [Candidatus Pelagibacter sp.]